jgi:hypothetical protein
VPAEGDAPLAIVCNQPVFAVINFLTLELVSDCRQGEDGAPVKAIQKIHGGGKEIY